MNCLLEFFTMEKQKKFINIVQNREETFEKALESYKKLFLTELDYCLKSLNDDFENDMDNSYCSYPGCEYVSLCKEIHKKVKDIRNKDGKRIERFFDEIRQCYLWWIYSNTTISLYKFAMLLNEYELIQNDELNLGKIDKRIFFRGRCSEEFLNKKDMFHIPFNKRYNICNARFSLTGQPMLYLGNSVADIIEELDIDVENISDYPNLKISAFEFKKDTGDRKIFDLRCSIFKDDNGKLYIKFDEKKFFRNILCYICSFQKRSEIAACVFKEEYVIPQLLAQTLKQHNYTGICYYSTKSFAKYQDMDERDAINNSELNMRYRENIALFTNSQFAEDDCPYDEKLYKELEVSMPISINNLVECSEEELKSIYSEISSRCLEIYRQGSGEDKNKANEIKGKAESIVSFYSKVFARIKVWNKASKDYEDYNNSKMGWLQIQLIRGILKRLFAEIDSKQEDDDKKSDVKHIEMKTCDIYGRTRDEIIAEDKIHREGILHKAQMIYFIKFEEEKWQICMKNENGGEALVYTHEAGMKQKLAKDNLDKLPWENIGHFIIREYSSEKGKPFFINDFEYIEVMVCEHDEVDIEKNIIWKDVNDIEKELQDKYDKFKPIYQRALPILLEYIKSKTESENDDEER